MSLLETVSFGNLLAGHEPQVNTRTYTVKSGQNLATNQCVALDSAGKVVAYDKNATSTANTPKGVMAYACDATSGDTAGILYITGNFNERKIVFKTGQTADDAREGLRIVGIILRKTQIA